MSNEAPILDADVIAELRESVGGDQSFVVELASTFLGEGPDYVRALEDALARGDITAAVRAAHTLKSSSAALGAMRLSEISRSIENAARQGRIDGLVDAVADVTAVWEQTVAAMKERGLVG